MFVQIISLRYLASSAGVDFYQLPTMQHYMIASLQLDTHDLRQYVAWFSIISQRRRKRGPLSSG